MAPIRKTRQNNIDVNLTEEESRILNDENQVGMKPADKVCENDNPIDKSSDVTNLVNAFSSLDEDKRKLLSSMLTHISSDGLKIDSLELGSSPLSSEQKNGRCGIRHKSLQFSQLEVLEKMRN